MTIRNDGTRRRALAGLFVGILLAGPAHAAWTERGVTISSMREILPSLRSVAGPARIEAVLPDDTPVLVPDGADLNDPKAIAVALIHSGIGVRQQANGWTLSPVDTRAEAQRAALRLRQPALNTPAASDPRAIKGGTVVLFGRVVAPPFRVERVGETIEVNGVVVYPSPGIDEGHVAATARQVDEHARMQALLKSYPANRATLGEAVARTRALADARAIPGVTAAAWVSDEMLRLTKAGGAEENLYFGELRVAEPETPGEARDRLDEMTTEFGDLLRGGGALLGGATYLLAMPGSDGGTFRKRLGEIRSSAEPEALKLARIQAWTGHRDAAADLLFAR